MCVYIYIYVYTYTSIYIYMYIYIYIYIYDGSRSHATSLRAGWMLPQPPRGKWHVLHSPLHYSSRIKPRSCYHQVCLAETKEGPDQLLRIYTQTRANSERLRLALVSFLLCAT